MGVLNLNITTARSDATLQSAFETPGGKHEICQKISNFINSINSGNELAQDSSNPPSIAISIKGNATRASGTLTLASVVATNTCAINGVTFTAVASGATGNQFNVGVSDTATATNLAAAINASASSLVSQQVTATSSGAVVTVYSKIYGVGGNTVTLTGSANITASGARLTGGAADPNAQTISF
jgi:phage tail sheath gpL-like